MGALKTTQEGKNKLMSGKDCIKRILDGTMTTSFLTEGVDSDTLANYLAENVCLKVEAVPQNSKTWYEMMNDPQFVFLLKRVRYHQGIVPEPLESIDGAEAASSAGRYGVRVRRRLASHR